MNRIIKNGGNKREKKGTLAKKNKNPSVVPIIERKSWIFPLINNQGINIHICTGEILTCTISNYSQLKNLKAGVRG